MLQVKKYDLLATLIAAAFIGCSTKKESSPAALSPQALGTIITDSIAPPVITMISDTNAPLVIKAGKPVIVPLTHGYGEGVPFITHYGVEDGLALNSIRASATDQQGNIWFATGAGISKFDGSSFTNYNQTNGLLDGFPRQLFADSRNRLWVAIGKGLNLFNGRYFDTYVVNPRLPGNVDINVRKIFEDKNGNIWLAAGTGLYQLRDTGFVQYTKADGLADNFIQSVLQDRNGDLLISSGKGITRYDGKSFTPYTEIPASKNGGFPLLLYCDSKGRIWFNNNIPGELGIYDGREIKIYSQKERDSSTTMAGNTPVTVLEDQKGNIWLGGFRELAKFDGKRFVNYAPKEEEESMFQLVSLTEDAYGNIWAATLLSGIYKVSPSYLSKIEIPAGIGIERGMVIDKRGIKWMRTTAGLCQYNSDHIAIYQLNQIRAGFAGLFMDRAGNKWFQGRDQKNNKDYLIQFNDTLFTMYDNKKFRLPSPVRWMMEDDAQQAWFAGSRGIARFDGVGFTGFNVPVGDNFVSAIFQDSKRNYWIGSDSCLFKYDGNRFTRFSTRDGLPDNFINDITEDGSGNLWLGTDGGAASYDGKSFRSYIAADGLGNVIGDVEYDPVNQCVWMDNRAGLASVSGEKGKKEKPHFQLFNSRNGFNFSVPNGISIDGSGVVWVRDNGISRFDYQLIKGSKPIPLLLKNVLLDNREINWNSLLEGAFPAGTPDSLTAINEMALKFGKTFSEEEFREMSAAFGKVRFDSTTGDGFIPVNLVLPYKNNNIGFEFGSISSSFGKAVQYQYLLEGYDKNWSPLSNKTEASFGNISEGRYTFRVKALSPFGTWSEITYSFRVLPPWWRSWWAYVSYVLLLGGAIIAFIRWRTKKLKKEKIVLEERVATRTNELKESLENLKATQGQLIHAEKMASLGELTAGIAHEIQNPLNFVNNFSELSRELVDELKSQKSKLKSEEQDELLNDIDANLEKINHHGNRAADIVKGMLQHSRTGSGQKEPTDINALCDEYLRLAYHGLRAKDKNFNATIKTDFDESIGSINIIPQDIGRVLLNLINNAFYTCTERLAQSKADKNRNPVTEREGLTANSQQLAASPYEPTVSIITKKTGNSIEIRVADNGNGIPQKVLDKIFQPFFTTKPTGQGTGLGLSLSYDIVKAHGGEIRVETKEGEGTEFIVSLPSV